MAESKFTVRMASEDDFQAIADFFSRYDFGPKRLEWVQWKYLHNPEGKAILYVAVDSDDRIVSISPRTPRRFVNEETGEFTARQNVDLLVADDLRKTGVYAMISKQAGSEREYLLIGFPNKLSRRLVNEANTYIAPVVNWAFPVLAGRLIAGKTYGAIAPLVNLLCTAYAFVRLGGIPTDISMKPLERFVNDYDVDTPLIHGVRSSAYLNWRFLDNPMQKFDVFEFCEGSESIGYCAYKTRESSAELYDFVVLRREKGCLRLLIEELKKKSFSHLSFPGVELHLERLGFFDRGSIGDFTAAKADRTPPLPNGNWMVTFCDRDV